MDHLSYGLWGILVEAADLDHPISHLVLDQQLRQGIADAVTGELCPLMSSYIVCLALSS